MDEGVWEYGGMTSLLEQRGMSFTLVMCMSGNVIKYQQHECPMSSYWRIKTGRNITIMPDHNCMCITLQKCCAVIFYTAYHIKRIVLIIYKKRLSSKWTNLMLSEEKHHCKSLNKCFLTVNWTLVTYAPAGATPAQCICAAHIFIHKYSSTSQRCSTHHKVKWSLHTETSWMFKFFLN